MDKIINQAQKKYLIQRHKLLAGPFQWTINCAGISTHEFSL